MSNLRSSTDFNVYRCPDPLKSKVNSPWYRFEDVCPCDPNAINITGRGFTPCALGIQFEDLPGMNYTPGFNANLQSLPNPLTGTLYNTRQIVPPQLQPRQNSRIGQVWRSSN